VVCVISYTGYDMEDAMIINKSSYERGFGHGTVYKSYLRELNEGQTSGRSKFRLLRKSDKVQQSIESHGLDRDGLPFIGQKLEAGQPDQCIYDSVLQKPKFNSFKDNESARVENVRLMGDEKDPSHCSLGYTIRYSRNPVIGDKFSSRHGQKGTLGQLWPQIDMPFTESGMTPDIIINPHAFPSRMTIGMLIESLAGKGGALKGEYVDVKPFEKYEDDDVVDYFGRELAKQGYNYYGNETMYAGTQGVEMKMDIFIGLVYY
jgi:DNA-directed RNA polymerase I subunit RPA2